MYTKTAMLLIAATLPLSPMAAVQEGKITGYIPFSHQGKKIIFIKLEDSIENGCNTTGRFAMNDYNPRYEGTAAAAMAAYHSQEEVKVVYGPTCNTWFNSADIQYICIGDIDC